MATLADLETAYQAKIAYLKTMYNENEDLNQEDMDNVSHEADLVNETWNPDLPPRPHN